MIGETDPNVVVEKIKEVLSGKELSISSIKSELDKIGVKVHRLTLSGFLDAMVALGELNVKHIKPSKIYSISEKKISNFYDIVGKVSRDNGKVNSGDFALDFLYRFLSRPVFMREIELCDVEYPRRYERKISDKKERWIEMLNSQGITIESRNPLIIPNNYSMSSSEYEQTLKKIIAEYGKIKDFTENSEDQKTFDNL
ncbi:hypothetical protein [Caldiplasma sukawensis]